MVEIWDNLKTVLYMEVTGELCAGLFVYYDTASDLSDVSVIAVHPR